MLVEDPGSVRFTTREGLHGDLYGDGCAGGSRCHARDGVNTGTPKELMRVGGYLNNDPLRGLIGWRRSFPLLQPHGTVPNLQV